MPSMQAFQTFVTDYGLPWALLAMIGWGVFKAILLLAPSIQTWIVARFKKADPEPKPATAAFWRPLNAPENCPGWCARLRTDLACHPVFESIASIQALTIPTLQGPCHARTLLFRDAATIVLTAWQQIFSELRSPQASALRSDGDLSLWLYRAINRWHVLIVRGWEEHDVPLVFRTFYNWWLSHRIDALRDILNMIVASPLHFSAPDRAASILSSCQYFLRVLVHDASYLVTTLNGTLTGQVYRGYTFGPLPGHLPVVTPVMGQPGVPPPPPDEDEEDGASQAPKTV